MEGPLFIGIDGGGTSCRARIRDSAGSLIGEGAGGPANARLDSALVMNSILTASRAAAHAGGLGEDALDGAHAGFGLAGANLGIAREKLLAERHPFAFVAIETDAYVAWLGAHCGEDGAILIMGTGSCGLAVVGGQQFYVSGYGAEVGDEASGAMMGREAIRRSLWAYDGRAGMTPLAEQVLAHFGNDAERIIAFATHARPGDYGAFVPMVLQHAETRDTLALTLVGEAASEAARMIRRLLDAGAPSVCLLGGLAEPLTQWLPPPIRARLSRPQSDAMEGAILMAKHGAQAAGAGSVVAERI